MTSINQTLTSKEFFEKLTEGDWPKYAFLFGNGINCVLPSNIPSWKQTMNKLMEQNGLKNYKKRGLTLTEQGNLVEIETSKKWRDANKKMGPYTSINRLIFEYFQDYSKRHRRKQKNEDSQCPILEYAWKGNHHILTTNFDDGIEKYITKNLLESTVVETRKVTPKPSLDNHKFFIGNRYYNWNCCWSDVSAGNNGIIEEMPKAHDIWHIHGQYHDTVCDSMIASMTRYCKAISKAAQMVLPNTLDDSWCGSNTWLDLFFKKPLIIAGLALTEQEIFPRFLLLRKAQWPKSQNLNHNSFFLIGKDKPDKDGRSFLQALGFQVVEFETRREIYTSPEWRKQP